VLQVVDGCHVVASGVQVGGSQPCQLDKVRIVKPDVASFAGLRRDAVSLFTTPFFNKVND
jgi:hypothetical protein